MSEEVTNGSKPKNEIGVKGWHFWMSIFHQVSGRMNGKRSSNHHKYISFLDIIHCYLYCINVFSKPYDKWAKLGTVLCFIS